MVVGVVLGLVALAAGAVGLVLCCWRRCGRGGRGAGTGQGSAGAPYVRWGWWGPRGRGDGPPSLSAPLQQHVGTGAGGSVGSDGGGGGGGSAPFLCPQQSRAAPPAGWPLLGGPQAAPAAAAATLYAVGSQPQAPGAPALGPLQAGLQPLPRPQLALPPLMPHPHQGAITPSQLLLKQQQQQPAEARPLALRPGVQPATGDMMGAWVHNPLAAPHECEKGAG
jgi:hypothetical protein